jgi:hypothetical protein
VCFLPLTHSILDQSSNDTLLYFLSSTGNGGLTGEHLEFCFRGWGLPVSTDLEGVPGWLGRSAVEARDCGGVEAAWAPPEPGGGIPLVTRNAERAHVPCPGNFIPKRGTGTKRDEAWYAEGTMLGSSSQLPAEHEPVVSGLLPNRARPQRHNPSRCSTLSLCAPGKKQRCGGAPTAIP